MTFLPDCSQKPVIWGSTDAFSEPFMKTCILGHVRLHAGSAWDSGQVGCVVEDNILSHNVLHSDEYPKYGTRCQLILCLTIDYPPPRDTSFPSVFPKTGHFKNETTALRYNCSQNKAFRERNPAFLHDRSPKQAFWGMESDTDSTAYKKSRRLFFNLRGFGRDDVTRTRDPYVPNVVRYQLRYISIS